MAESMGIDHDTLVASLPKQNGMLTETLIDPSEIGSRLLVSSGSVPS